MSGRSLRSREKLQTPLKSELAASRKRLVDLVNKKDEELTAEDRLLLQANENLVKVLRKNLERKLVKEKHSEEYEENIDKVMEKCKILAVALKESRHAVVYTGAGVSTSADIPDYRGTNGVWTLLKRGKEMPTVGNLMSSKPTQSHMCLRKLFEEGIVKHIVSQNCDGLHLRSGVPTIGLSEIHGNMYTEVCQNCDCKVYHRIFDVTQKTSLRRHKTGRDCDSCGSKLKDTIVHFGEWSNLRWPHNWEGAVENAEKCDLILCLGTSLKVLRSYRQLWMMNRPKHKRPDLYIANLQWTPKDSQAKLKIHARVDFILNTVLGLLGFNIPAYNMEEDPLLSLATPCAHTGPTIPVPKRCEKKFKVISTCRSLESRAVCSKFLSEHENAEDPRSRDTSLTSLDQHSCDIAMTSIPPSWFGKGIRSTKTSSRCRKRKRSEKMFKSFSKLPTRLPRQACLANGIVSHHVLKTE